MAAEVLRRQNVSDTNSLYDWAVPVEVRMGDECLTLWVATFAGPARSGERIRILLLHGNPSNLDDWRDLACRLNVDCEVAAMDLPGFGRSECFAARAESRLEASARCVVALADRLGWREPFFIVGHSHGAAVAQIVAGEHPCRVAGLVLIGTLGSPAHPAYRLLAFPGIAGLVGVLARLLRSNRIVPFFRPLLAWIMRPIFHPAAPSSENVKNRLREFAARPQILISMAEAALGSPSEQLASNAPKISAPTLFIHGSQDRLVPSDYARRLNLAMVAARTAFEVVSGAGHMVIGSHPAEVERRILAWVRFCRGMNSR